MAERGRRARWAVMAWALVATGGACKGRAPGPGAAGPAVTAEGPQGAAHGPEVPFTVQADSLDVVFTWFDAQGGAHTASRVDEVPAERRETVRVDPSRPELRRPGWVYVADLRRPRADGNFPVRTVRAEALAQAVMAQAGMAGPLGSQPPPPRPAAPAAAPAAGHGAVAAAGDASVAAQPSVIIYGASWCSACHQAAAYLQRRHIAFVEKDIEQDPAAAQEMAAKAQRAGVPTGSIPILDVRGTILRGFSPEAIEAALQRGGA